MFQENQVLNQTYKILYQIGTGGSGCVYLAYHLRLEKYVVVKQISIKGNMPPRNEADVLKSLHHPNLPQVYDYIEDEKYVYTVMDYVEGNDLQKYIDERCLCSADDIIRWYKQLVSVLVYIHEHNPVVIHSDIKPSNIIITPQNDAVLIDFNISLGYSEDVVMGLTFNYASPEQVKIMQQMNEGRSSEDVLDGRSDIYSLAATFYHLMFQTVPSPVYDNPKMAGKGTGYPDAFCLIIDKSLERIRENRYQTAALLKHELENIWKKEKGYRIYVFVQAVVILTAAALISFGSYFLIKGSKQKEESEYAAAYNRCIQMINSERYSEAQSECMNVLSRYGNRLENNPSDKAELLKGVAESLYGLGLYDMAGEYYCEAADLMENMTSAVDCYSKAIISCYRAGDKAAAEKIMKTAGLENSKEDNIKLLRLQIMAGSESKKEMNSLAGEILDTSSDADILCRTCITMAEAAEKNKEALEWYKKAMNYSEGNKITYDCLRQVGYDLLKLALSSQDIETTKQAMDKSVECYEILTESDECKENDFINLSTTYRLKGEYQKAVDILNLEISKIPNSNTGIIYMHKAFIYDECGNSSKAVQNLKDALDNSVSKETVSDEEWKKLMDIADRNGLR